LILAGGLAHDESTPDHSHGRGPASLADLGHRVGAGERTLSRLFHEETGMSFPQWRTQLRIHRALLMLADGDSVLATATACGWERVHRDVHRAGRADPEAVPAVAVGPA
jgi:transcriptional regulator GlxA family with amidase domain